MLAPKIGLFLVGGGFIGAAATGTWLSSKYLGDQGAYTATTYATQEGKQENNDSESILIGIKCQNENGVMEEIEIVEREYLADPLREPIVTEFKDNKGKCLTSSDQHFNYY